MAPMISTMRSAKPDLEYWTIEGLESLLTAKSQPFPYHHDYDEVKDHPILVLHSSGSTGVPKPITMTHATFAVADNDRNCPTVPGRRNHDMTMWEFAGTDARIYDAFPPFHLGGLFFKVILPVFTHTVPLFGPPLRPASGTLVTEIMQQQNVRGLFLPPVVAEQLLHDNNGLKYFQDLDVFCYAGGPLSQAAGDVISTVTTVCQYYGSTETGQIRQLVPEPQDWSYIQFHPHCKLELQPAVNGACELVLFADDTTIGDYALNHNVPGVRERRTRDLFMPHPTKKDLWKFYGRRDDILVLSSGEKFSPVPAETALQQHPAVAGALVVGQSRPQPALLIEPKPGYDDISNIADDIWPLVEQENLKSPGHGRVARSLVLVVNPQKPFVRAGKGTIVRALTEEAYKVEIDELYADASTAATTKPIMLAAPRYQSSAVVELVRSTIKQILPATDLGDKGNFYGFGLDSLKTMEAAAGLKSSLSAHRQAHDLSWITPDLLYRFPTISDLGNVLLDFLNDNTIPQSIKPQPIDEMSTTLQALINGLSPPVPSSSNATSAKKSGLSVVLTGSTGWLATHLLKELSASPTVAEI
ncbi:MAG: hypothetical protein Q9222_006475, partial [Ikaeria aurantiellina]